MKPIKHTIRQGNSVQDVNGSNEFDEFLENGDMGFVEEGEVMSNTDRRIESLKRAIDIAKLMSNVTVDDVMEIAEKIDTFIRDFEL